MPDSAASAFHVERPPFTISTHPSRLDVERITAFLQDSYWARGIPRSIVEHAIRGSLCFGVYEGTSQVGFARAVTDRATYAWIADVFILESHRGRGLGRWLMETIMAHPDLQGLRRIGLATLDAHGLYEQVGFTPLTHPERHMEIVIPGIYLRRNDVTG